MSYNFYPSGARIADRYEVAGHPLVGGMGIVYLCFDHQEQRPVALKTFKPDYLPDRAARERFLREGTTWVALGRYPHVVHAYGVERIGDGRGVYLVLELVAKMQGRQDASLRSYFIPGRPLPIAEAVGFALQIARGMAYATATVNGFVHRDLKPENVLVGADRLADIELNRVRVTDFGLVRAMAAEAGEVNETLLSSDTKAGLTQIGSVMGTPAYMAPEQWTGADVAIQADIYALGCIMGEMLTGRWLAQTTLVGYQQAHQEGHALQAVAGLPAEVQDALKPCLAVAPGMRYGSWAAVTQALDALYTQVTGRTLPESGSTSVLRRGERVAVGWSYNSIGFSYLDLGQATRAVGFFTQAQQVGQDEGERHLEGAGLGSLGSAYRHLGDARRALDYSAQALTILRGIGDRRSEGVVLSNLGLAFAALGDIRSAIGYHEQALTISRRNGDRQSEGHDLGNLGEAYRERGDAHRAIGYYERALTIHREIGNRRGEGHDLANLGSAYLHLGDVPRAIGYYNQALVISRETSDRLVEGGTLGNLGEANRRLGDTRNAIGYYEQALTIFREIGDRRNEGNILGNLGIAYYQLGDTQRTISYYEHALTISREIGDRRGESTVLGNLGLAYGQLRDALRAIDYYEQALPILREIGDANTMANYSINIALLYAVQGSERVALHRAREAARLFAELGHAANAERAQQLVAQLERQGG